MGSRRVTEENLINSIVGPGTFFRGHIELDGLLRVDGDFSGSLKSTGRVIIGRAGRADCAIEAGTVVIGGVFRGEVFAAEKVVLLSSAVVIGTIRSPRLVAEDGVLLTGLFEITGSVERLGRPDSRARKKDLLLESVRTREAAGASSGASAHDGGAQHDAAAESSADLATVRGGDGEWNG